MAHITIEYVIMVPILIMQIFLFPLSANVLMNIWVDSRRTLALQDAASHLGGAIQQMYFSLNHKTISAGTLTQKSNVPRFIEGYPYTGNATLNTVMDTVLNSSKVLKITLKMTGLNIAASTSVVLGNNVEWIASTFVSNSTKACINAEKVGSGENYIIRLSFGG